MLSLSQCHEDNAFFLYSGFCCRGRRNVASFLDSSHPLFLSLSLFTLASLLPSLIVYLFSFHFIFCSLK